MCLQSKFEKRKKKIYNAPYYPLYTLCNISRDLESNCLLCKNAAISQKKCAVLSINFENECTILKSK